MEMAVVTKRKNDSKWMLGSEAGSGQLDQSSKNAAHRHHLHLLFAVCYKDRIYLFTKLLQGCININTDSILIYQTIFFYNVYFIAISLHMCVLGDPFERASEIRVPLYPMQIHAIIPWYKFSMQILELQTFCRRLQMAPRSPVMQKLYWSGPSADFSTCGWERQSLVSK